MNIFSVLDTSDGEEEVVQKGNNKKKEGAQAVDKKQPAKTTSKPQQSNKPRDVKSEEPKAAAAAPVEEAKEKKDDNRGGRARGKEGVRRGDKHHSADETEKSRRPKREFERRSGTGRGREVSRGGRGPYGFGNVEQEAHDAEKDPSKAEAQPENVDETAEPEPESTEVAQEVEEPPTLSFDDFLKKREEARLSSSVLSAARAPRQVNLETQFAGLTAKEDELEDAEAKGGKTVGQKKDQRSTNKTQLLDVQFKFEVANNPRSERREGGRGERREGGRGERRERDRDGGSGRGGRGPRPARKPRDAPAPLNSGDFPSL